MFFHCCQKQSSAVIAVATNKKSAKRTRLIARLPKFVQGLLNGTIDIQVKCCRRIRKISSIGKDPPFDKLIESGIIPHLIEYLKMNPNDENTTGKGPTHYDQNSICKLQLEATWILTNISASSDHKYTKFLISTGAVKPLANLLLSPNKDVAEHAVLTLGNIAGDSPEHRDIVLLSDALTNLIHLQNRCIDVLKAKAKSTTDNTDDNKDENKDNNIGWTPEQFEQFEQLLKDCDCLESIELLRYVAWTIINLSRGKPEPDNKYIKDEIESLNEMFRLPDTKILSYVAWGFRCLTDTTHKHMHPEKIKLMKQCGALKRLVQCLDHNEYRVRHPAVLALGNIVTGSHEQTQDVIDLGLCDKLLPLLDLKQYTLSKCDRNGEIKLNHLSPLLKELCWMISNIAAGTEEQIHCIIIADIFPTMIHLLKKAPCDIRKDVVWTICNVTSGGNVHQIEYLVNRGAIPALVSSLGCSNSEILPVAMDALNNILKCGEKIKNEGEMMTMSFYVTLKQQAGWT